jgi:hypothetical protein
VHGATYVTIGPLRTFAMGSIAAVQLPLSGNSSNSKPYRSGNQQCPNELYSI